jgi:hypothetical protein
MYHKERELPTSTDQGIDARTPRTAGSGEVAKMRKEGGMHTRTRRMVAVLALPVAAAACGDDYTRVEEAPGETPAMVPEREQTEIDPAIPSDSGILADTAKRDITVPNDPGPRG